MKTPKQPKEKLFWTSFNCTAWARDEVDLKIDFKVMVNDYMTRDQLTDLALSAAEFRFHACDRFWDPFNCSLVIIPIA